MPVKIIADSTCDLPKEMLEKHQISIVPLTVSLGKRSGHDGVEITPEDIYEYVEESGKLPQTAAVSVWEFVQEFRKWRDEGCDIVCFTISSSLSSSYQNAVIAGDEVGSVFVIDSRNLSLGVGMLALHAAKLSEEGKSAEEIVISVGDLITKMEVSFVPSTIEYLKKGGRCSALAALGANLFKIRPCIEVEMGNLTVGKKYRGSTEKILKTYLEERLKDRRDIDTDLIFVVHTKCEHVLVDEMMTAVRTYLPDVKQVVEAVAGSTITTHCGPGTFSLMFARK